MRVEERIDLDHQPMTVRLEGEESRGQKGGIRKKRRRKNVWTDEEKINLRNFGKKDLEREIER